MRLRLQIVTRDASSLLPAIVCVAALIGLVEAAALLSRRPIWHQLTFVSPDVVWMAPLGYLLVFMEFLAGCIVVALIWSRFPMTRFVLFGVGFLGVAGMMYTVSMTRLHPLAIIIFAAGVGYRLSRSRSRWWLEPGAERAAVLAATAGLVIALGGRMASHAANAGPRTVGAPVHARNVLLIVWDTVRELNLSLHGYDRPTTPSLERWARRGVIFDRAYATSSWTLPSHASLFTGRFPHELNTDWLFPLDATFPTLAEVLRAEGYQTAGFVANPYYTTRETGLGRGFQHWDEQYLSLKEIVLNAGIIQWLSGWRSRIMVRQHDSKRADEVTEAFLRWLDTRNGRPFFAFLNYFDAHIPYRAPPELRRRFAHPNRAVGAYDAAIANLDAELDRLLGELQLRGLLGETIVVVTSDHGEQFGNHGLFAHGNSLYRQVVQVPYVLLGPSHVPSGLRVLAPVSLRNLPATLLDLAGIRGHPLPGVTHTRFWRDTTAESQDRPVLSELTPAPRAPLNHRNARGEIRSLVLGSYHYICCGQGKEEVFNLLWDPRERRNLASRPPLPVITVMRTRLSTYDRLFPRKLSDADSPN